MKRLLTVPVLALVMGLALGDKDATGELEELPELDHLDLKQFRTSRQFQQAAKEEDGVAIGLIDALQRWADALEAQISIMKNEVLSLKSNNRHLKDEVSRVQEENVDLKGRGDHAEGADQGEPR